MPDPLTVNARDLDIMARTIWGEAEAKDVDDAVAIAWVIRNRVVLPNWPGTVSGVCLQPYQFSCWNTSNPRRQALDDVTDDDPWFAKCRAIASEVIGGHAPDPTWRSTHYYATYIATPKWARGKTPVYETPWGRYNHLFYNDIDTPPPQSAREALDQTRPVVESRTARGAGGAAAGGAAVVVDGITQTIDAIERGGHFLDGRGILMTALGLGIVGFALWALYARVQDREEGKR